MDTNKTLLELDLVYKHFSLADTISLMGELSEAKEEFETCLEELRSDSNHLELRLNKILEIEEQLEYLEKNIKTLLCAIEAHETKVFEKRTLKSGSAIFCLN